MINRNSEEWRFIQGYGDRYLVSNFGRVKSVKMWDVNAMAYVPADRLMTPTDNGHGYLIVSLRDGKKRKNHYVHRLVATAFVDNPRSLKYVNHIDFNTRNNAANNLEWCTQRDNILHSCDRMKHPKTITHSNTGERYITFREKANRFRVIVSGKEYGSFASLKGAIKKRDSVLKGAI